MENVKIFLLLWLAVLAQGPIPDARMEVYFVVDKSVIDRYVAEQTTGDSATRLNNAMVSFNADVDYFITEINKMYASLRPMGLCIEILKKRLDVLNINVFSDNVNHFVAIAAFDNWLANSTVAYDAAILWTWQNFQTAGVTHASHVCRSVNASGVVLYDMTYGVAIYTAHELGHLMGANHDPDYINGYVMEASASTLHTNRWSFSMYSKYAFDTLLAIPSYRCLSVTSSGLTVPSAAVTDALADPDTICRRARKNKRSFMCKSPRSYGNRVPQGDWVCNQIWCREVNTNRCHATFPSDGLICGTNKRCNRGRCQDHPDAESAIVDPNCIWGDQAEISLVFSDNYRYEGDCARFIDMFGSNMCYYTVVALGCCETCHKLHTGINGCEYGDLHPHCNRSTKAGVCDCYSEFCCLFCQGYKKKRSSASTRSLSGVTTKVIDDLIAIPDEPYTKQTPRREDVLT
ncbi:A disintegrin and metalloproteinase with thrombospondin motifs 1 [Plakobranchus ocellatus]|uniref:A disintegrin and metalloproteinase with thrombospondin motifs 1 n=1 Tax=Plakobranchus ocellatus TaxID=259542 RepID=A0AAV4C502_9GAST|nr:A disintegrin and metalloproteinase with thrombospondin motifs 1 [Plakobranchus ocellatus]